MRFFNALFVMLAPICPHLCEHVWGTLLGHAPASVTRAPWPSESPCAAGDDEAALLASDAYLSGKLHEFRVAIAKVWVVKPSKAAKGVQASAPRPTHATVYVATAWPAWQRKPLELLAGLWDAAAHSAADNCGFPADALTRVKELAMSDAEVCGVWGVGGHSRVPRPHHFTPHSPFPLPTPTRSSSPI